jgi:hypothetical protein
MTDNKLRWVELALGKWHRLPANHLCTSSERTSRPRDAWEAQPYHQPRRRSASSKPKRSPAFYAGTAVIVIFLPLALL